MYDRMDPALTEPLISPAAVNSGDSQQLWHLTKYLNYANINNTRLTALCPGLSRWASTGKEKNNMDLLKQETGI